MINYNKLKILFIEDLPSDVDLAVLELRREHLVFDYETVCTREDLLSILESFRPDLIISDYLMPTFDGMRALLDVAQFDKEIPFILYTGSINEETAVKCLKAGAVDYVIKEHMTRLPFAVKEALEQVRIKKEKRASELLLKESEQKIQSIFRAAPVGIGLVVRRIFIEVNDTFCKMTGYSRADLIGKSSEMIYPSKEEYEIVGSEKYRQISSFGTGSLETKFKRKDGTIINILMSSTPLDNNDHLKGVTFTALDITSRKQNEDELKTSLSLLNASLESTADGILIVNGKGGIIKWNQKFAEMWSIPEEILKTQDDNTAINHILSKLKDPEKFIEIVQFLYQNPDKTSFDKLEFTDGSVFERFSQPQKIDGEVVGRVWSFSDVTVRHIAEESLKLSEEKFRSIAENLSDVIFLTDNQGILKYVSPSSRILGYEQDELVERFFGDFLMKGEIEKAMPLFQNALNEVNLSSTVRLSFKRKDESAFFAELSGSVFKVGNEIKGVLGLLRDVSDKVRKEIELRKLSQAVEQNPVSIIITNTVGVIEYVNPKFCEVTGYSAEELLGKNPSILSSHQKTNEEYWQLWNTIKSGNEWKGEFHNRKKNGDLYWESALISPIKNEDNQITHFLGIKEDITLRKALEASSRDSEQRYRELFLNSPVPTYIFDETTLEFIDVNDAAVVNYGYSREEFMSLTLKDLRLPEEIPVLMESITSLSDQVFLSTSMRHRRKDGSVFPVEIISHPIPVKSGRKTRLVVVNNITDRIKAAEQMNLAREKAEASDRLKTTFLNNISHEVRTPLNGILGFAEILNQPGMSEEEKKESLSMLYQSSDRLLNTITSYMDISLLTSGVMSVNKKDLSPSSILRDLYSVYSPLAVQKKLDLILDIPEESRDLIINSDPGLFKKIISHLLDNAVKFTELGSITFGYIQSDSDVKFFVRDTGIGIGKEALDTVFDKFIKEERSPRRVSEGSGLGLSIAKGMTEIIGGKIKVESNPGSGSEFILSMPLVNPGTASGTATPVTMKGNSMRNSVILIAEDDETNFFYLKAILKRETDTIIIHARNGREAIEFFKDNPDIILVLMDIKMPEIDGIEATRQIKILRREVPVIAITAYAMAGDEDRLLDAGCDGYLSKPISKEKLLRKIDEFVKI
jgi:PAS domain S-box-containing protein